MKKKNEKKNTIYGLSIIRGRGWVERKEGAKKENRKRKRDKKGAG